MKNSMFSKHRKTTLVLQLFMCCTETLIRGQCLPSFCPQNVTLMSPVCAFWHAVYTQMSRREQRDKWFIMGERKLPYSDSSTHDDGSVNYRENLGWFNPDVYSSREWKSHSWLTQTLSFSLPWHSWNIAAHVGSWDNFINFADFFNSSVI